MTVFLQAVAAYYEERAREHGPTPWGVDWTCEPTQQLRFVQLLKVVEDGRPFSLNDVGCGYAALLPFLRARYGKEVRYVGVDVAPRMIELARKEHARDKAASFAVAETLLPADYSIASGIFNVQLGHSPARWRAHVKAVLERMYAASRKGFAVNFLAPARRGVEPLEGLYRASPSYWHDFCTRRFGAHVEVLRGYGLREFTLLVRLPSKAARRGASGRAPSSRTAP